MNYLYYIYKQPTQPDNSKNITNMNRTTIFNEIYSEVTNATSIFSTLDSSYEDSSSPLRRILDLLSLRVWSSSQLFSSDTLPIQPYSRNRMVISIEGNIGAGKSTLLEQIRLRLLDDARFRRGQIVCMQEPVDLWESVKEDCTGESILKKFYKDPAKYAFSFQVMAYTSRLTAFQRIIENHPECQVILCERSLEADRNIFAKMMYDDGMIDEVSYKIYKMLYDNTAKQFPINTMIYLDVSPETCLERVNHRARDGEGQIALEYLSKCDKYYRDWILSMDIPVKIFSSSASSSTNCSELHEHEL